MAQQTRSQLGRVRVHRSVLQPTTTTLHSRIPLPRGIRERAETNDQTALAAKARDRPRNGYHSSPSVLGHRVPASTAVPVPVAPTCPVASRTRTKLAPHAYSLPGGLRLSDPGNLSAAAILPVAMSATRLGGFARALRLPVRRKSNHRSSIDPAPRRLNQRLARWPPVVTSYAHRRLQPSMYCRAPNRAAQRAAVQFPNADRGRPARLTVWAFNGPSSPEDAPPLPERRSGRCFPHDRRSP
jgi:hypothetical protein